MRHGSIVGGVLSSVFSAQDAQEQEVRDPDRADVDDGARDDLVHLVADAQPGEEEADGRRDEHGRRDADRRPRCRALPVTSRPRRSRRPRRRTRRPASCPRGRCSACRCARTGCPRARPSVIGTANSRLPAIMPVRFAGLPSSSAGQDRRDPRPRRAAGATAATGTARRGRAAGRATNQRHEAGDDPQDADRSSAASTRCAALLVDPERERRGRVRGSGSPR